MAANQPPLDLTDEGAMNAAADTVGQQAQTCYDLFYETTGLPTADFCAPSFSYLNHAWQLGNTWTSTEQISGTWTELSNLRFEVDVLSNSPVEPPQPSEPGTTIESCEGPAENDGAVPSFSGVVANPELSTAAAPVSVDVLGPQFGGETIAGSASLGAPPARLSRRSTRTATSGSTGGTHAESHLRPLEPRACRPVSAALACDS